MEIKITAHVYNGNGHLRAMKIPLQDSLLSASFSILHTRDFIGYELTKKPSVAIILDGSVYWKGYLPPMVVECNGDNYKFTKVVRALSLGSQIIAEDVGKKKVVSIALNVASEDSAHRQLKGMHFKVCEELERQGLSFTYAEPIHPDFQAIQRMYEDRIVLI